MHGPKQCIYCLHLLRKFVWTWGPPGLSKGVKIEARTSGSLTLLPAWIERLRRISQILKEKEHPNPWKNNLCTVNTTASVPIAIDGFLCITGIKSLFKNVMKILIILEKTFFFKRQCTCLLLWKFIPWFLEAQIDKKVYI